MRALLYVLHRLQTIAFMHIAGHELVERLNAGTCGTVYRAYPSAAVKLVPAARVSAAVAREVSMLARLSHPNILCLHRVVIVPAPSADAPAALALVTELLAGGDLFDAVSDASFPISSVRKVLADVVSALVYLSSQRVVHADIKLENVCLTGRGEKLSAKLIDFGSCRDIDHQEHSTTPVGTAQYLAPELVRDQSSPSQPTFSSDAWALGVMLYAMLSGTYPFESVTTEEVPSDYPQSAKGEAPLPADYARDAILELPPRPLPSTVPDDLRTIVDGLLIKDPAQRLSVHQLQKQIATWPCSKLASGSCDIDVCESRRLSSPVSPVDADIFDSDQQRSKAPATYSESSMDDSQQSLEEMLRVVEFVRNQLPSQRRRSLSNFVLPLVS